MEIVGVGLQNFKGFPANCPDIVQLSRCNLIVGKNNAGKSSILEGLDLFFNGPKVEKADLGSIAHNGNLKDDIRIRIAVVPDEKFLRELFPEPDLFSHSGHSVWHVIGKHAANYPIIVSESLKGLFGGTKGPYAVNLEAPVELLAIWNEYKFRTQVDPYEHFQKSKEQWIRQIKSEYKAILIPFGRVVNASAGETSLELDGSNLPAVVDRILTAPGQDHGIIEDELQNEILQLFPEFTDKLRIRSKTTSKGLKRLDFQEPKKISMSLDHYGSGLRSILVQIAHLVLNRDMRSGTKMIFMVEEPELGLHPFLQRKLLSYYRSVFGSQKKKGLCILTVQSPSFIDWSGGCTLTQIISENHSSRAVHLSKDDVLRVLDDIGFFQSHLLQYDVLIFVEGPSDANTLRAILQVCGVDLEGSNVGVLPLGGDNIRTADIAVLKRINPRVIVWIDSDRESVNDNDRPIAWKKNLSVMCSAEKTPLVMSLEHRTLENLLPARCYREFFKDESIDFGPFDNIPTKLLAKSYSKKFHTPRIAALMTKDEILAVAPFKKILDSLSAFGVIPS